MPKTNHWTVPLKAAAAILFFSLAWAEPLLGVQIQNAAADDWTAFRGSVGDGKAIGADLPTDFSDPQIVSWKTAIPGKGWSSPVIADGQIWLTTATPDGKTMSAMCVDLETGDVLHDRIIHENENPAPCHPTNSYASPTPVIDAGKIYIHFGSYGTTCLDAKTGEPLWQRTDLPCDHHRGPASSPIVFENLLIVAFDGTDQQYVVALDKETGETVWKRDRDVQYENDNGDRRKAYGTGVVFEIDGRPLLIYPSSVATIAYRPASGEPVWTVYHGGMNVSARPLLTPKGNVIITNGMGEAISVDPIGEGDITKTNINWTIAKVVSRRASPLIVGNRLYMISDNGIASCVNADDGSYVWQERIGGKFSSSLIFDGENIFALEHVGVISVFKPADTFELVAQSKLGDGFRATPAVSGKKLILRSLTHLYCVEAN